MKYVVLVYNNPGAFEALSPADRNVLMTEADAFGVGGAPPHPGGGGGGSNRRAVRGGQGAAGRLLRRRLREPSSGRPRSPPAIPPPRYWAVEVRPIMDEAGTEM